MTQTLFEISKDMENLDELLVNTDCSNPEVEKLLTEWGKKIMENLENKVDNYACLVQTLLARSKARKEEAIRLASLAKTDENNAKSLKERLMFFFHLHDIKKLDTRRFRVSIVNNGGALPLTINCEPEELPEAYRTSEMVYKANKDGIRQAIEAGQAVEGCTIEDRGTHLRIK